MFDARDDPANYVEELVGMAAGYPSGTSLVMFLRGGSCGIAGYLLLRNQANLPDMSLVEEGSRPAAS